MARPTESKPWHAEALRLRNEGLSFGKIATLLEVNISTLKAYCARTSNTPERQLQTVLDGTPRPTIATVVLPELQQERLIAMMLSAEEHRIDTIREALRAINTFQGLSVAEMKDEKAFELMTMKMRAGIETLKALKGAGNLPDFDQGDPKGGGRGAGKGEKQDPEERRKAVRERLNSMSTSNT